MPVPALLVVLERARELGYLGPGPVERQLAHAEGFAAVWSGAPPGWAADLGSGGGVPALVLAMAWPSSHWMLIEATKRRAAHLRWAIEVLEIEDRVEVLEDRAEVVGRGPFRGRFDLVTARSFGSPAVTAECAAPLLHPGGRLLVSEPPEGPDRWDAQALADLGFRAAVPATAGGFHYVVLEQDHPVPDRFPRRTGIPAKRPLF